MSLSDKSASMADPISQQERRKRLGQYFTGVSLAKLLGALAEAKEAASILDPMVGTGDMLEACLNLGAEPENIAGLEIDPHAYFQGLRRLPQATFVLGNAFDPAVLKQLPRLDWQLVISNPPYVRYQSTSQTATNKFGLPDAHEIRNGLAEALQCMSALDEEDRMLLTRLVYGYSGLADLAVPSWILCSALVADGGRLALVVPDSWLSRDYAAVVQYLLLRWFKIEYIVEDESAIWFENAQVRTNLIIASRIKRRESAFDYHDETLVRIRLSRKAVGPNSMVEQLFPHADDKELRFSALACRWEASGLELRNEFVDVTHVPLVTLANNLYGACSTQKWFVGMEKGRQSSQSVAPFIPQELHQWADFGSSGTEMVSLASLGVHVGQGLRTGANAFFYADAIEESDEETVLSPDPRLTDKLVRVSLRYAKPVLRKQSELPSGYVVRAEELTGRVLVIRDAALPEDIDMMSDGMKGAYELLPESLADFVRLATSTNFGTETEPKHIYELSAVAPNARRGSPNLGIPPRFWYMIPDFKARHNPDLIVPRVNHSEVKALLNLGRIALIDANFSTVWLTDNSLVTPLALLALFNSSWIAAALELSASVMGGGALKVEATHLRRLPIPDFVASDWRVLTELGRELAATDKAEISEVKGRIDVVVASSILGREALPDDCKRLKELILSSLSRRIK